MVEDASSLFMLVVCSAGLDLWMKGFLCLSNLERKREETFVRFDEVQRWQLIKEVLELGCCCCVCGERKNENLALRETDRRRSTARST